MHLWIWNILYQLPSMIKTLKIGLLKKFFTMLHLILRTCLEFPIQRITTSRFIFFTHFNLDY